MIPCPAELSHYELHRKLRETVTDNSATAASPCTLHTEEREHVNETNYHYSIISPPMLVAKSNKQKGGVISSEYGMCVEKSPHVSVCVCV